LFKREWFKGDHADTGWLNYDINAKPSDKTTHENETTRRLTTPNTFERRMHAGIFNTQDLDAGNLNMDVELKKADDATLVFFMKSFCLTRWMYIDDACENFQKNNC